MYGGIICNSYKIIQPVCNVVIIIQKIKDSLDILQSLLISQLYSGLRDHGNLCLKKRNACCLKSLAYCTKIIRSCENLIAILFLYEILSACVKSGHHQLVSVHLALFLIDDDLTLLVKHVGYAALGSDASVTLCKCVSYIAGCTVLVVSKSLNDDGNTIRTISFVYSFLVAISRVSTCCLLNTALDGIVRHVVCFRLGDNIAKLAVVAWIRTAGLNSHYDLTADDGKDLTFFSVVFFFLVLYVCEF